MLQIKLEQQQEEDNRPSFAPSLHSGASAGKANLLEVRMLMIKLKQRQKEEHPERSRRAS